MVTFSLSDFSYMQLAMELASNAKGKTFPNPAVGAVVVSGGEIVGKGATQVYGGPHAEKVALARAGRKAKNAVLYVTLEPCCHFGRTPPCTDAIIAAGIKTVFVSVKDPNPLVSGKGIRQLKKSGITVHVGLMHEEATLLNEDFFWSVERKRAWVTLKLALTLDGRIADISGNSKWITSAASRKCVHEFRRCHAAVAVGRGTLECDNPSLNVRHKKGYSPARIVFSPDKKIAETSYFYTHSEEARSIVVVRGGRSKSIINDSGIEYWFTGEADSCASLNVFLQMAFEQKITSVFVEGGQRLASEFLEAGLVNRLHLFYGNKLVGSGKEGIQFSGGLPISDCISLQNISHTILGSDILVSGIPRFLPLKSSNN